MHLYLRLALVPEPQHAMPSVTVDGSCCQDISRVLVRQKVGDQEASRQSALHLNNQFLASRVLQLRHFINCTSVQIRNAIVRCHGETYPTRRIREVRRCENYIRHLLNFAE